MSHLKQIIVIVPVVAFGLMACLVLFYFYNEQWDHGIIMKPLYEIETGEPIVALTFDDGPSSRITPRLLLLLNKHDVKATFFMVGKNIESNMAVAEDVYSNGHLIGNHSYDHSKLVFKGFSFVNNQIDKTEALIRRTGQTEVKYFRPPYCSKFIVLPLILSQKDKILVTGTYDPPSEYKRPFMGQKVAEEVINNVKAGSIIFLHDGMMIDENEFLAAVELIITELKKKGYRFVRLDCK